MFFSILTSFTSLRHVYLAINKELSLKRLVFFTFFQKGSHCLFTFVFHCFLDPAVTPTFRHSLCECLLIVEVDLVCYWQVHVLPPSGMSFPPTKVEAAVGSVLAVPLIVSAKVSGRCCMLGLHSEHCWRELTSCCFDVLTCGNPHTLTHLFTHSLNLFTAAGP